MKMDELESFGREVRDFVQARLPADIALKVRRGREIEKTDYVRWQQILQQKGWLIGAWPRAWGGEGWDPARQLVFLRQSGLAGAPMIIPYGINMVGPVLQTFGSPVQQKTYLPGILDSTTWWCQGYSEPGAGSDLASLKTSAVRDGDFYVVNGSKMWTTEAHWADMMHCLVRTDGTGRRQDGITFLMIDMATPGITVRPIVTIDGQHHTNQIFFDDVRVPVDNIVGAEGNGWKIAKFLLGHERISIADTGPKLRLMEQLRTMNREVQQDPMVSSAIKARLATKLTDVGVQLSALLALETHFVSGWARGRPVGADGSMLKVRGTEVLQALSEVALDLEGPYAAVHDPADLHRHSEEPDSPAQRASAMAHQYLYGRCWSIFGGTNEIQRNIIAKHLLA